MKRFTAAAMGLLSLFVVLPASAADLPRGSMPYKAPGYLPTYNWTGFYLGINGGGAFGDSDWNAFGLTNSPSGGMIGVTAGFNWQALGSPWVFGIEGDVDWTFIDDTVACPVGIVCKTQNNWLGTVRGRVGYAWDRLMPYVTGGIAFGDIEVTRTGFIGASDNNVGWTIGAGLEGALGGRWTAKVEYLYVDLLDIGCSAVACGIATNVDLQVNVLRAGLNYRF
jgi:outer membrane immunogenic protein